jgi:hypothetical protein
VQKKRTSYKAHSSNTVGQDHFYANGHMFPSAEVVSCPNSTKALGTGVERAGKYEGAFWRV